MSDNSFLDNGDESEISADISLLPGESDEEDAVEQQPNTSCSSKDRRTKIAKFLKDRKDAKMTKKLNCETQMLNCTKEDLGLQRKIAVGMEKSDTEMLQAMTKVNKTMESIGDSIKHGFALMAEIMKQTQAPSANFFPPQYPASFFLPQPQAPQATQNWIPYLILGKQLVRHLSKFLNPTEFHLQTMKMMRHLNCDMLCRPELCYSMLQNTLY